LSLILVERSHFIHVEKVSRRVLTDTMEGCDAIDFVSSTPHVAADRREQSLTPLLSTDDWHQ
jgi:hypothetical protein